MKRTLANNEQLGNSVNTEEIITYNKQPSSVMDTVTLTNHSAINQMAVGGYLR